MFRHQRKNGILYLIVLEGPQYLSRVHEVQASQLETFERYEHPVSENAGGRQGLFGKILVPLLIPVELAVLVVCKYRAFRIGSNEKALGENRRE